MHEGMPSPEPITDERDFSVSDHQIEEIATSKNPELTEMKIEQESEKIAFELTGRQQELANELWDTIVAEAYKQEGVDIEAVKRAEDNIAQNTAHRVAEALEESWVSHQRRLSSIAGSSKFVNPPSDNDWERHNQDTAH